MYKTHKFPGQDWPFHSLCPLNSHTSCASSQSMFINMHHGHSIGNRFILMWKCELIHPDLYYIAHMCAYVYRMIWFSWSNYIILVDITLLICNSLQRVGLIIHHQKIWPQYIDASLYDLIDKGCWFYSLGTLYQLDMVPGYLGHQNSMILFINFFFT